MRHHRRYRYYRFISELTVQSFARLVSDKYKFIQAKNYVKSSWSERYLNVQWDDSRRRIDDSDLGTFTVTQLDSFIAVRRVINTEIIRWRQFITEDFHGIKNNVRGFASSSVDVRPINLAYRADIKVKYTPFSNQPNMPFVRFELIDYTRLRSMKVNFFV